MIKQASPKPNKHVLDAIKKVLDSGMYVKGPEAKKFEEKFSQISGCKYNIAVNSGTSALNLILIALDYPPSSEIIIPINTFLATGNAVETSGYNVKFADADYKTLNIDVTKLPDLITEKTKAIVIVHLYGQPVDMDAVMEISEKYNIDIIEDACQAHGAKYNGKIIGSFGRASAFSFFPTKNLSVLGDGGMASTNDEKLAKRIESLRNVGREDHPDDAKYFGYNMRMSEIIAAIGNAMFESFFEDTAKRIEIATHYTSALKGISEIELPFNHDSSNPVWHQYTIKTDVRDELKEFLKANEIQTSVKYSIPLHLVEAYQKKYNHREGDFPIGEKACNSHLCLPMHPGLSNEDIQTVANKIKEFFNH